MAAVTLGQVVKWHGREWRVLAINRERGLVLIRPTAGGHTETVPVTELERQMEDQVPKISTGQPSTLKTYRMIARLLFPKALPMIDARIEAFGENEIVVQHESQMLYLFAQIQFKGEPEHPAVIFTQKEVDGCVRSAETVPLAEVED